MSNPITLPTFTTRLGKGAPLTFAEGDANLNQIRAFCLSLLSSIDNFSQTVVFADTGASNAYSITASSSVLAPNLNTYANGQTFLIFTTNASSGASTLNVNALGAVPIQVPGGLSVSFQIVANSIFSVTYWNGVFLLNSGSGSGSGSSAVTLESSFSGINTFQPQAIALLSAAGQYAPIAHGLGSTPNSIQICLVNATAEGGYTIGQQIPAEDFTDGAGNPAFTVAFDNTNIYITQAVANPFLLMTGQAPNTNYQIATGNWLLQVVANVTSNYNPPLFPALTLLTNSAMAATYHNTIITFAAKVNAINMLNANIVPITSLDTHYADSTTFNGCVMLSGGVPVFYFTTEKGLFKIPLVQFNQNIIPNGATYDGSGAYVLTTVEGVVYSWVQNANDTDVAEASIQGATANLAASGNFTAASTSATLNGVANAPVTAEVLQPITSLAVSLVYANTNNVVAYKPAQIDLTDNPNRYYCLTSNAVNQAGTNHISGFGFVITAARMVYISSTGAPTAVGTALDLTSATILNNTQFNVWHPSGSGAHILLLQWNPVSRRLYVITDAVSALHIFTLDPSASDLVTWWQTAVGVREPLLSYVKSIAIPCGLNVSLSAANLNVEFDVLAGNEAALCINAAGSITRVPWIE